MTISGKAQLAGVMGWPVSHSLSPALHGYWLDAFGIDGAYVPLPVHPDDLGEAIAGLRALGFRGCNVTVPHKEAVMRHLDDIDAAAQAIGAVNTVVIDEDGFATGYNTDAHGFLAHLAASAPVNLKGATVTLLGAGGAARAIAWALLNAGVAKLRLVNRNPARAEALAGALTFSNIDVIAWDRAADALEAAALLVNSTTLGMTGQPALDLDLAALPATATVYDIVYNPLETPLLAAAAARGLRTVDGLGMLLHQAAPGFEAWFGVRPDVTEGLRAHALSILKARQP